MHNFLLANRDELVARCKEKAHQRSQHAAPDEQLGNGVTLFLDQLTRTLLAERQQEVNASALSSGALPAMSELGMAAAKHDKALLERGFTVAQAVHAYGDLCRAICDLAHEHRTLFSVDEYHTLNCCVDNAIADTVAQFSAARDVVVASWHLARSNEKLGVLVHELRNSLQIASLAARALESGGTSLTSPTGGALRRSLTAMGKLVDSSLTDVRSRSKGSANRLIFALAPLIRETQAAADLEARARGCVFKVGTVDPRLRLHADPERLRSTLANLLSNAFKFSHSHGEVSLSIELVGEHILMSVADSCGGLPASHEDKIFAPFMQFDNDRSGLGLGLFIARQNVESDGGTLTVKAGHWLRLHDRAAQLHSRPARLRARRADLPPHGHLVAPLCRSAQKSLQPRGLDVALRWSAPR